MEKTAEKMEIMGDGDGRLRRKKRPLARPVENTPGTWYTEILPENGGKYKTAKGEGMNETTQRTVPSRLDTSTMPRGPLNWIFSRWHCCITNFYSGLLTHKTTFSGELWYL